MTFKNLDCFQGLSWPWKWNTNSRTIKELWEPCTSACKASESVVVGSCIIYHNSSFLSTWSSSTSNTRLAPPTAKTITTHHFNSCNDLIVNLVTNCLCVEDVTVHSLSSSFFLCITLSHWNLHSIQHDHLETLTQSTEWSQFVLQHTTFTIFGSWT